MRQIADFFETHKDDRSNLWRMRLIKSLGVALVAAVGGMIGAVALWVLVGFASVWTDFAEGSGSVGAYAIRVELLALVGLIAGTAAFVWQWRRQRRVVGR
jgi:hypothetical protein